MSNKFEFELYASQRRDTLISELLNLLKHNKKWWLLPLLAILVGFGVLTVLSGTVAGPFIYSLF